MAPYIKYEATAPLVMDPYEQRGVTKQQVAAEFERAEQAIPLRERMATWRAQHPMPAVTGDQADKAFFDDLSGDL